MSQRGRDRMRGWGQTNLGTGLNLQRQVLDADLGNLLEDLLGLLGVAVDPALRLGEELRAAALDHVAEEGPRGAAEADQRNAAGQLVPRHGDGLVDVVELARDVDLLVEDLAVLRVLGGLEGLGEVGALLVDHLDRHAHGLGDHEDVGEDDGGVDQAGESVDGLEGDLRGDLRVAAAGEEVAVALGLMVFGEVPAGWGLLDYMRAVCGSKLGRYIPCRITHMGGRSISSPAHEIWG